MSGQTVTKNKKQEQLDSKITEVTNFYLKRLETLVGGRIVGSCVDTETDAWNDEQFFGLQIMMPDKSIKLLWIMMDDEGNGPGSFSIEKANGSS